MGQNKRLAFEFESSLLSVDRISAENVVQKAINEDNIDIFEAIDSIISPALTSIGFKWEQGEIALSQEYMASKIASEITNELLPPGSSGRISQPVIGITTLEDKHMLGKQILMSLIYSLGFNCIDYGSMPVKMIKEKIIEDDIEILFISTLMLNQALTITEITDFIEQKKTNTKVIVGGAPFLFDDGLWEEVKATAFAMTAVEGMHIAKELMEEA